MARNIASTMLQLVVLIECFWRLFSIFKKLNSFLQPLKCIISHHCLNRWKIMTNYYFKKSFCNIVIHNLLNHKNSHVKSSILPLILGMLANVAYVVLTNNHPWMCKCYFTTTCIFLQSIKLRNQCLFFLSNLTVNPTSTSYLGHLLFKINNYFNPWTP